VSLVGVNGLPVGGAASAVNGTPTSALPENPTIYLDASGNDANSGLSSSSPMKTLAALAKRIRGAVGIVTVSMAAGTFALPSDQVLDFPAPAGDQIKFLGSKADSGLSTRTSSSGTAGSGIAFATVTDAAGGLTVNAWQGWVLRCVSATQANNVGQMLFIFANSATTYTLIGQLPAAVTNGDTWVIEKPATIWSTSVHAYLGVRRAYCEWIDFQPASAKFIHLDGVWTANQSWVNSSGNGGIRCNNGLLNAGVPPDARADNASTSIYCGILIKSTATRITSQVGGIFDLNQSGTIASTGSFLFTGRSIATLSQCGVSGGGSITTTVMADLQMLTCRVDTGGVSVNQGSRLRLSTCDISNVTGAGLTLDTGAFAEITALTGTGNTTYGVSHNNGARSRVSDPGSGTTITGTTADVLLGGAGAKAWSAINTGNAADTNDYAATTPENVSCSK